MDSLREKWLKKEWEREEETQKHKEVIKKKDEQLYQLHRHVSNLIFDKTKLRELALNLLTCRRKSPSYPVFLWEHYYLFQLKEIYENRSYLGSSTHSFLEIFHSYEFDDQSLLCELFLHNVMCEYVSTKMVVSVLSYMGDLQLRAFLLFMRNQIEWHMVKKTVETSEERTTLWVSVERGMTYELQREFRIFLTTPKIREQSLEKKDFPK